MNLKLKVCVLGATEFLETKDSNVNCFAKARILLAAVTSLWLKEKIVEVVTVYILWQ